MEDEATLPKGRHQGLIERQLDQNRTVVQRTAIALLLFLAFGYFFWPSGGSRAPVSMSESFPSGPAGLADESASADAARALALEMESERQADEQSSVALERRRAPEGAQEAELEAQPEQKPDLKLLAAKLEGPQAVAAARAKTSGKSSAAGIPDVFSSPIQGLDWPIQIKETPEGGIWLAHRAGVTLFTDANDLGRHKQVLTAQSYDAEFNDDLPPVHAIGASPDTLWTGFVNGQLMRYQRYEWRVIAQRGEPIRGRIEAVHVFKDQLFAGGSGLYIWDKSFNKLIPHPEFREQSISSFSLAPDGTLYMGGMEGLWRYNDDAEQTWELKWKLPRKDFTIRAIHHDRDGSMLLGTNDGVVRISKRGVVTDRMLSGSRVTSVTAGKAPESLWVGTHNDGLRYYDGEQWFHGGKSEGLSNRVPFVHLDRTGRLWVGTAGIGTLIASEAAAAKWISAYHDAPPSDFTPVVYTDACHAASEVLEGVTLSRDIAVQEIDGRSLIFAGGKQVCPAGVGSHRLDGTTVLLQGWNVQLYRDGKREELTLPEEFPADTATALLYDSRGRVWVGTEKAGAAMYEKESWHVFGSEVGLANNPVKTIMEDERGNVWFGTTPPWDENSKTYHLANLHLYNDEGWFHFDSRDGILHNSSNALSLLKDGSLLIATRAGVSVLDRDGMLTNYSEPQGLSPYYSHSVRADDRNRIWIAHQFYGDGISWIDETTVHRMTSKNGLFDDRIVNLAFDRSKRLWVFAANGSVAVYPISYLQKLGSTLPLNRRQLRPINIFG